MIRTADPVRTSQRLARLFYLSIWFAVLSGYVRADDPSKVERLFLTGKYDECAAAANEVIARGDRNEIGWVWAIRSAMSRGRYDDARKLIDEGLAKNPYAVHLRLLAYDILRRSGDGKRADGLLHEIDQLAGRASWRYSDAADRVALGRAALLLGIDPRQVLEQFYDRARKEKPELRDVYLAIGDLALDKHDEAVAAESFEQGLKRFPDDPDMHFGLARSFATSDSKRVMESLEAALGTNPNHIPSLLLLADNAIDSEQYTRAEELLVRILDIDPRQPDAWGYRAVLARLAGDSEHESEYRAMALQNLSANPAVDHLIGRKLAQKYRFAEGVVYQRRALDIDAEYLPAKIQLAQDLLRLGDDEGWRLADAVHDRDPYDVTAYNLVTLRDNIANYRLLRDGPIIVRMEPREADLYGDRVLQLLRRARDTLGNKYGFKLTEPVTIEIFPVQNDFAVRTFGMPGGAGFLGVCFGKLITANSPASHGEHPTSWESVLWHEFCHVVTLQLTHNKMPRWISEGISVYEERQADPAWGQRMNPKYREMILGGELTPVQNLSAAFLAPPSGEHLSFAYFESSLVVEFMVERFGHAAIRQVLDDLAQDVAIDKALQQHANLQMAEFEQGFAEFARVQAQSLAPAAEFDRDTLPKPDKNHGKRTAEWLKDHPKNFWGNLQLASELIAEQQFVQAKAPLARAIEIYPGYTGPDNAYTLLARVHKELNEPEDERRVLSQLTDRDADAVPALLRLLELDSAANDWASLATHAERLLGANPLLPQPHRALARAAEQLDRSNDAIACYRRLLIMDPEDPADLNYRLARLLFAAHDASAKRHALMALEEAPRFPEALRLLLEIERAKKD